MCFAGLWDCVQYQGLTTTYLNHRRKPRSRFDMY
jgi:hypothetical protein